MNRRLVNLAVALSLLPCLTCLGMWARSGFYADSLSREGRGHRASICSSFGDLRLYLAVPGPLVSEQPWMYGAVPVTWAPSYHGSRWMWKWPKYSRDFFPVTPMTQWQLVLPYWLLTLISGILPALRFWRWRKAKRLNRRGFEVLPAPAARTGQ